MTRGRRAVRFGRVTCLRRALDGSDERDRGPGAMPEWTPNHSMLLIHTYPADEGRIVAVSLVDGSTELVILSINRDVQPLLAIASGDIYRVVAWHPSKNTILFSVREQDGEPYHFRLFDLDKKESYTPPNQHPALQCLDMSWSRDGKKILFVGEKDQ